MLERFRIEGFKKFDLLELPDLDRMNIIVGINDAGKTSLLEALLAFACGTYFLPLQDMINAHRVEPASIMGLIDGNPNMIAEGLACCFHNYRHKSRLEYQVLGRIDGGADICVRHSFRPGAAIADMLSLASSGRTAKTDRPLYQNYQGVTGGALMIS